MFGSSPEKFNVWSVDLIRKLERVQRRATKYILDLPFICDQTYGDRLMNLNLLPISCWQEFLDMIFFFKVLTGTGRVSPSVLPQVLVTRTTRSNSNSTVTVMSLALTLFQGNVILSLFRDIFFYRATRIWNTLAKMIFNFHTTFRSVM